MVFSAASNSLDWANLIGAAAGLDARGFGRSIDRAKRHLFGASAARDETDSGLDQAHIKFGMGLAASSVKADFGASAEAHPIRRDDHRTRAELDRRRHSLKGTNSEIDLVPLALLRGEQQLHQVRADGEVRRIAGDDEAPKIAHRFAVGLERLGDQADDIVADGVFLRVKLDAGDAIADVDQRGPRLLPHDSVGLAIICNRGCAFWLLDGIHLSGIQD